MKRLLIDIPCNVYDDPNMAYLLQEKIFVFLEMRDVKYLKDYQILYRENSESSKFIKKLIDDWDLESISFTNNKDEKMELIRDMVAMADDALLFYHYENRFEDIINKVIVDQCVESSHVYVRICRLDWGNRIY